MHLKCPNCKYQWRSGSGGNNFASHDFLNILEELEAVNSSAANEIESQFLAAGRASAVCTHSDLFRVFAEIHHAWANFSTRLNAFGPMVQVYDDGGQLINEFETGSAFDVIQKELGELYYSLGRLANASWQLGEASNKGGVEEIKVASDLVQEARARLNVRRERVKELAIGSG